MFDIRVVESPCAFDGTKTRWRHWSTKLRGFVRGVSKTLADMMKIAESQVTKIRHDGLSDGHIELSNTLFSMLSRLTESDAYDIVLNVEEGNGLEAWRRLVRENIPKSVGHNRSRLMHVLEPKDIAASNSTYTYRGSMNR